MPKFSLIVLLFVFQINFAQTHVKGNALSALLLVPHIGIETSISDKLTFQADVMASFWKSIGNEGPFQFVVLTPEIRYHFNEVYNGFYLGAHIAGGAFKLKKWNYLESDLYQEGYSVLIGATIGYQKQLSRRVFLDFFIGGGNQQGFYMGYDSETQIRYDGAENFNKSGEWLPYRGGIMLSYLLN
jgi:hypothetical protein